MQGTEEGSGQGCYNRGRGCGTVKTGCCCLAGLHHDTRGEGASVLCPIVERPMACSMVRLKSR